MASFSYWVHRTMSLFFLWKLPPGRHQKKNQASPLYQMCFIICCVVSKKSWSFLEIWHNQLHYFVQQHFLWEVCLLNVLSQRGRAAEQNTVQINILKKLLSNSNILIWVDLELLVNFDFTRNSNLVCNFERRPMIYLNCSLPLLSVAQR